MKAPAWAHWVILAALTASFSSPVEAVGQNLPLQQAAGPRVWSDDTGLTLEWQAPALSVSDLEGGQVRLEMPGFPAGTVPGTLALPQSSALIALPDGAAPEITVIAEQSAPLSLAGVFPTVPARGADEEAAGDGSPLSPAVLTFEEVGVLRGARLGRVVFTPVHRAAGGWQKTTWLRVRIDYHVPFSALRSSPGGAIPIEGDPILSGLRNEVLNPEQITGTRAAPGLAPASTAPVPSLILEVQGPGLTQVTYEAIQSSGIAPESLNPGLIHLWQAGAEVALDWEGDADAAFEPGERFLFYADPPASRWAPNGAYQLSVGGDLGRRVTARPALPAARPPAPLWHSALFEKNIIYTPDCYCGQTPLGHDGDRWVWAELSRPGRPSASLPFTLPPVRAGHAGSLSLWLVSYTSLSSAPVDHRVQVAVNGTSLGMAEWDGKALRPLSLAVPPGVLHEGENTLTLTLPGISGVSVEGVWLDAFQVDAALGDASLGLSAVLGGDASPGAYSARLESTAGLRIYDIRDPLAPVRLTNPQIEGGLVSFADSASGGARYAVASEAGLRLPAQARALHPLRTAARTGADYLVITHPDFAPALPPLLGQRAGQGLVTALEDVGAIYDHYGDGTPSPGAIRAFLADVYRRWSPRPLYVLLVGDGSTDPKGYHADSHPSWVPPMLQPVDPWLGETAADNRYVTVDGNDALPDMIIGRLPVNTLEEAQAVVAKILRAENQPAPGPWPERIVSIADDTDSAADFSQMAEAILSPLAGTSFAIDRVYFGKTTGAPAEVQSAALDAFQSGSGLILFTGHASIHQWGAENFFHISQVPLLTNAARLPLLLEMDCLTASFQVAGLDTTDETLVRYPGGGVVAAWGSTGFGVATGHHIMAQRLVQDLYRNGQSRLGLAVLQAKLVLAAQQPGYTDLLDTYTILGDPASQVRIQAASGWQLYLPSIHH